MVKASRINKGAERVMKSFAVPPSMNPISNIGSNNPGNPKSACAWATYLDYHHTVASHVWSRARQIGVSAPLAVAPRVRMLLTGTLASANTSMGSMKH
jgi:hypothetical protein